MKHLGLISALALILICNLIAFMGVYENRRGEPHQTIELTERELPMQSRDQDDTSVRLRLAYRRSPYQFFPRPEAYDFPFDRRKLEELGFDCSIPESTAPEFRHPMPRIAFVALEYEGMAWKQWSDRLPEESATKDRPGPSLSRPESSRPWESTTGTEQEGTRLFVVDAAQTFESLRQKYPDPKKVLIVRAVIHAVLENPTNAGTVPSKPSGWGGYVAQILPIEIYVPLPFSGEIANLAPRRGGPPRYRVTLHFGSRWEPWVESLTRQEP